eukprot:9493101-Pyramimonas_sp.AAC.1
MRLDKLLNVGRRAFRTGAEVAQPTRLVTAVLLGLHSAGYTVFTARAHLNRGHCCGVPKTKDGEGALHLSFLGIQGTTPTLERLGSYQFCVSFLPPQSGPANHTPSHALLVFVPAVLRFVTFSSRIVGIAGKIEAESANGYVPWPGAGQRKWRCRHCPYDEDGSIGVAARYLNLMYTGRSKLRASDLSLPRLRVSERLVVSSAHSVPLV